jgi:hypothetical protein
MMPYLWRLVLLLASAIGLFSHALPAQGADQAHFQAVNLTYFVEPAALPDISLPDLQGQQVALRSFTGKVLLLNFWTTW